MPRLETPPVLVVHSGTNEDRKWLKELASQLRPVHLPFWCDPEPGQDAKARFQEVLDSALVVVLLVSADLLGADIDQCSLVHERVRSSRGRNQVVIRPILVRSCVFDHPLLQEFKPINEQALASLPEAEAGRYLAETARRLQENVKSAFRLVVRGLLNERPRDVTEHINRVVCLLDQAGPYLKGALLDVADIAAYLLQELLGSGARMPSKKDDPALIDRVVTRLYGLCKSAASNLTEETYHQLDTVIRCLEALRSPCRIELGPGQNAAQRLLPLWISAAERPVETEGAWAKLCSLTLSALTDYFTDQHGWGDREKRPLPLVRIFHCIWLCAMVLKKFPPRASEVRTDLAYVLREGLRFLCFGFEDNEEQRRPYYYFDTARYTSALRTVVTYHAIQVLGAPFEPLVGSFLRAVGSTRGVNHYPPAEHLQHILEIYMAGIFILGVELKGRHDDLSLAEAMMGGKRDDGAVLSFQRAFILAALFHDVGHLVLPRIRPDIDEFGLSLAPLRDKLYELRDGLSASINRFAATCVDRLASYAPEPELTAWLLKQRERPGHGLLGAWYLLDVCHDRGLDDWVLRSAVRAVLLHNALTVRLSADQDPIAALLVLGDELYEWDPTQPMTTPIGKSLQVIAPEVPTHEPRDRWIHVEQLHLGDQLGASLDISGASSGWPTIHIELQGPQRLTMPIYKLWFRKSQNLGRIVRARCGFGPVLVMTSTSPFEGDTNRAKIEALKRGLPDDLLPILEGWLEATDIEVENRQETIHLRSFEDHPELHEGLPRLLTYIREQVRED